MTVISAVILLGVLIFVHEFGHFIFAKLMSVKVLKFSLGFGPKLIGKKMGETEYLVSALPLGGYVKMLGEEPGEELTEEEKERAFHFQPLWRRAVIVLAGPLFNILLTYIIFTGFLSVHIPIKVPSLASLMPVVTDVVAGSPAVKAGFQKGDKIIAVDGNEITTKVERGGRIIDLTVTPGKLEISLGDKSVTVDYIGVESFLSPTIGEVSYGSPAFRGGLKTGDKIVGINGHEIVTWYDMVRIIRDNPDKSLAFSVMRDGNTLEMDIVPKAVEIPIDNGTRIIGRIGVGQFDAAEVITSKTFLEAGYKGVIATYKWGFFIFDSIKVLIKGDISSKNIAGPITIVRESGRAATAGLVTYLMFMALISVNLGILNLLPIPILDGGHLMFIVVERIKGAPLSDRTVSIAQRIGLALLLALMVVAFYNDIMRIFVWK
jgi:regulator of sigma E protease